MVIYNFNGQYVIIENTEYTEEFSIWTRKWVSAKKAEAKNRLICSKFIITFSIFIRTEQVKILSFKQLIVN